MTSDTAAPATAAGRALLDRWHGRPDPFGPAPLNRTIEETILAIEAEAAPRPEQAPAVLMGFDPGVPEGDRTVWMPEQAPAGGEAE